MAENTCSVADCDRSVLARTWCSRHYDRWRNTGKLELPTVSDRFWAKVNKDSGVIPEHRPDLGMCWLWTAYAMDNGYGKFSHGTRATTKCVLAHRFAYELEIGPIPAGLELDHLCLVRLCVRPRHLEPVTGLVNNLRSSSPPAENARKTHCPRGHLYDEANTRITADGWRICRACKPIYRQMYPRHRKEAVSS